MNGISDPGWNLFLKDSVLALTEPMEHHEVLSCMHRKNSLDPKYLNRSMQMSPSAKTYQLPIKKSYGISTKHDGMSNQQPESSFMAKNNFMMTSKEFIPKTNLDFMSSSSSDFMTSFNSNMTENAEMGKIPDWTKRSDTRRRHSLATMPDSSLIPAWMHLYAVRFKRNRQSFYVGSANIAVGSMVLVEADRGQDIGQIVAEPPKELHQTTAISYKRILHVATEEDLQQMEAKTAEEDHALMVCRLKVYERVLNMQILDAEYQYDGNKLTFFFTATGRIDFRDLVKDLFSLFKTRIWMQQVTEEMTFPLRVAPAYGGAPAV